MSTYTEFEQKLLVGAYQYAELTSKMESTVGQIVEYYALTYNPNWLDTALDSFRSWGYNRDEGTLGGALKQTVWLSAAGMKEAERLLHEEGVWVPTPEEAENFDEAMGVTPISVTSSATISQGSIDYATPVGPTIYSAPRAVAPASDRIVSLDHNQPDYTGISNGLRELREDVRGANSPDIDELERDRVLKSLDAASQLWDATQLKVIQIKVGILITVEDASALLISTARAVAAALLVDTIKAFVKSHFGVDLDKI